MSNEPLKIKKRGEDGNKVITVRIKEEAISALDKQTKCYTKYIKMSIPAPVSLLSGRRKPRFRF